MDFVPKNLFGASRQSSDPPFGAARGGSGLKPDPPSPPIPPKCWGAYLQPFGPNWNKTATTSEHSLNSLEPGVHRGPRKHLCTDIAGNSRKYTQNQKQSKINIQKEHKNLYKGRTPETKFFLQKRRTENSW